MVILGSRWGIFTGKRPCYAMHNLCTKHQFVIRSFDPRSRISQRNTVTFGIAHLIFTLEVAPNMNQLGRQWIIKPNCRNVNQIMTIFQITHTVHAQISDDSVKLTFRKHRDSCTSPKGAYQRCIAVFGPSISNRIVHLTDVYASIEPRSPTQAWFLQISFSNNQTIYVPIHKFSSNKQSNDVFKLSFETVWPFSETSRNGTIYLRL